MITKKNESFQNRFFYTLPNQLHASGISGSFQWMHKLSKLCYSVITNVKFG